MTTRPAGGTVGSRVASRLGLEQARVAAMLLLTLRGTPVLYYGRVRHGGWRHPAREGGGCLGEEHARPGLGRDPARTPMQWDGSEHGGFTTGEPWLRVSPNTSDVNVAAEAADPLSMLTLSPGGAGARRRLLAIFVRAGRRLHLSARG